MKEPHARQARGIRVGADQSEGRRVQQATGHDKGTRKAPVAIGNGSHIALLKEIPKEKETVFPLPVFALATTSFDCKT